MDRILPDEHDTRLTLTPLNTTLGIFNVATRKIPDAWKICIFTQTPNFLWSLIQADTLHNIQTYIMGYKQLYYLVKGVCNENASITWYKFTLCCWGNGR